MNPDNCSSPSSSSCRAPSPQTPPFVLFLDSTTPHPEVVHCGELPEFTFATSFDPDDVIVDFDFDPLKCFSSSNDVGGSGGGGGDAGVDDDLFSVYIDPKKLEEKETNGTNAAGIEGDNLMNGGGFVVENGGGGRKRKDKSDNLMIKATLTKRRQRRVREQSCLAIEKGFLEPRKSMAAEDLAELWTIDPKRAKRIVANRHSAARSKERKAQYIVDLEEKVKMLTSEVAFLNTRLTSNQEETLDLAAKQSQLRSQLQAMECQAEQIDAQIEAQKLDIQWLRSVTWEMESSQNQQSYSQFPPLHSPTAAHQHKRLPLLQNCQQSMLPPSLHISSKPLI